MNCFELPLLKKEYLTEPVTVYNFEVEDWHTYYVSDKEILVHNMCSQSWDGLIAGLETSYGKSSLKFGDNDLVYGPSASGKLVELQRSAGGKLLSDVGNPYDMGYGSDWLKFSTDTIEDIDGILNGTSQYMNRTTSGELRYIRDNWDRLSGNIKFYSNGEEVLPPWMN